MCGSRISSDLKWESLFKASCWKFLSCVWFWSRECEMNCLGDEFSTCLESSWLGMRHLASYLQKNILTQSMECWSEVEIGTLQRSFGKAFVEDTLEKGFEWDEGDCPKHKEREKDPKGRGRRETIIAHCLNQSWVFLPGLSYILCFTFIPSLLVLGVCLLNKG